MIGRILAAIAFLGGGVLMWFVLAALRGFAASQVGMSSGSVPGPSSVDTLVPWFIVSYFAVSGIGVTFASTRTGLRIVAALAYVMLVVAYCALCFEGLKDAPGKFLGGAFILAFFAFAALLPWHLIWYCLLLLKRDENAT